MNLYKLTNEMQRIDELLAENSDPDSPEVYALLQQSLALDDACANKIDAYCCLVAEIGSRAAARKAEADRLAESARTGANTVARLKGMLLTALSAVNKKKVETERFTVTVVNNGGLLPLELTPNLDPNTLPESLKRVTISPDSEKIRATLEGGIKLDFAKFGERGQHVRIK